VSPTVTYVLGVLTPIAVVFIPLGVWLTFLDIRAWWRRRRLLR
jgi:hypothetical protein